MFVGCTLEGTNLVVASHVACYLVLDGRSLQSAAIQAVQGNGEDADVQIFCLNPTIPNEGSWIQARGQYGRNDTHVERENEVM